MDPADFEAKLAAIRATAEKAADDEQIYKFRYQARAELIALQAELQMLSVDGDKHLQKQQLAQVHLLLGNNYCETEESTAGERSLSTAQRIAAALWEGPQTQPAAPETEEAEAGDSTEQTKVVRAAEAALQARPWETQSPNFRVAPILVEACNNLAVVWSNRSEHQRAERYLSLAENIYLRWLRCHRAEEWRELRGLMRGVRAELPAADSTETSDAAPAGETEERSLKQLYTSTCFFFAQVYAHLQRAALSSYYCHQTLSQQLESGKEFDKPEWCGNCLHLSGFYLGEGDFAAAEHCLQAVAAVMRRPPQLQDPQTQANFHLAWGKYLLTTLKLFRQRRDAGESGPLDLTRTDAEAAPVRAFRGLGLGPLLSHLDAADSFDDARELFKKASGHYQAALKFYVFDGHVTDHISIQEDVSKLYRNLSFWETDLERKVAMHKRRAQLYDHIVGHINVSIYTNQIRQLLYELGEIYNEIAEIRQLQLRSPAPPGGKRPGLLKVNEPIETAIRYFDMFLNTLPVGEFPPPNTGSPQTDVSASDPSTKPPPEKVEEEHKHIWVIANMHVARLLSKYQAEPQVMQAWLDKSRKRYAFIVAYAEKHGLGKDADSLGTEIQMCREMAALLPGKARMAAKSAGLN
eukprot:TRINITY_DN5702_c0_g1_i1.p2 TRINITY_DN5702_c0_g1~~TRINITY_DN5702_c0_g1_i1.p2  ORF type:complete len:645 (-),score=146.22 TRINITY_DN5702_c0_g1_i1:3966-5870(-)